MHPEFAKYGTPPIKLIEECTELIAELNNLIKSVCKAERFGYDDFNPLDEIVKTNKQRINEEIADVEKILSDFKYFIRIKYLENNDIKRS